MTTRVAVITGASGGIGRALALAAAKRGYACVLSARGEEALTLVAEEIRRGGGTAHVEAGDVTDEAHRAALVARAEREHGRLDVLLNNAGRGYYAKARDVAADELLDLFALNAVAPLRLAQLALPLLTRSHGTVVMVSSIAGVVAAPSMGAYAASKFALEAIAMALRAEVAADGVHVLVVRPGPVETEFRGNSVAHGVKAGVRPRAARPQLPEEVAERTWSAVDRGAAVLETSLFARAASFAGRAAPPLMRRIAARMARQA